MGVNRPPKRSGVRLIEAPTSPCRQASVRRDGQWRIAPYYHHLFGSDELSQRSPSSRTKVPQPYIKLNLGGCREVGRSRRTRVSF
ncbi:hypothetical protein KCP71_15000 [Salmonella enterica subsp. enterica]|nr:hypothetical protein KCP71_15000 [Salmonella enterica subsp. enterica]